MNKIRHYINGQDYGEPRNWEDLEITIDWLNENDQADVNISELEFAFEAKDYLKKRIMNGLEGGVGIFEGEPYSIKVTGNGSDDFEFKGYLDFSEASTFLGSESVMTSLKKEEGDDWLNDVADSFSFAYLADRGVISSGDYIRIPYVINFVPDGMQLIILSMSIYMMTKEIISNIENIAETIADVTDAATPVVGVGVGVGAVAVTAWDLGNFILVTLKTIARIAYTVAMIIAIKNLIEALFEQLLPKRREHLGINTKTLFEKGCEYLGLQFNSNLINSLNWTYIPTKDRIGGDSGETGHPRNSDPIYTFGDCIRVFKKTLNADYRIRDGVFYFERKDSFSFPGDYSIPNFFINQERLLDEVSFNTDEMVSNYNIHWAYDSQDKNTLDDQKGRVFQAITTPLTKNNNKLVNIKNLAEIDIPFSQGKTKTNLTTIEVIAKQLGGIVDDLTGIFGGGTNFASMVENRVGSLLLSSHFLTVPKIVIMNGSKLSLDQREALAAKKLWDEYHYINSFALVNGEHNQYYRYEDLKVPMKLEEFNQLLSNNMGTDQNGNEFKVEKVVWSPSKQTAEINYRVKKLYTKNLKIEYVD